MRWLSIREVLRFAEIEGGRCSRDGDGEGHILSIHSPPPLLLVAGQMAGRQLATGGLKGANSLNSSLNWPCNRGPGEKEPLLGKGGRGRKEPNPKKKKATPRKKLALSDGWLEGGEKEKEVGKGEGEEGLFLAGGEEEEGE